MSVTVIASGTQTAVISTEHTLATTSGPGVYVFWVDKANLASGDTVELRLKTKILGGGTVRVLYIDTFTGAQPVDDMLTCSVPVVSDQAVTFTLKQTAGTGRQFPWKVLMS